MITQEQLDTVSDKVRDMQKQLSRLNTLTVRIREDNIFEDVKLSSTQKLDLLAKYDSIKQELVNIFKQLP